MAVTAFTALSNVALTRIGANIISDLTDGSPNAIKVNAVLDYVREEVLQARDWRFAKIRYAMGLSTISPLYGYQYAYILPTDFLRLVKPRFKAMRGVNPVAYQRAYWSNIIDTTRGGSFAAAFSSPSSAFAMSAAFTFRSSGALSGPGSFLISDLSGTTRLSRWLHLLCSSSCSSSSSRAVLGVSAWESSTNPASKNGSVVLGVACSPAGSRTPGRVSTGSKA